MYQHILVPTDGSELSARAVEEAIKLARCTGAKLTGFHAMPQYMPVYYGEAAMLAPGGVEAVFDQEGFEQLTQRKADAALNVVARLAREAGVTVTVVAERSDAPADAVVNKAMELGCDAIVMASHGRRGITGLLLGSETTKVLTHCKLPVLVVR
ncbi:MAG: universal stress protein [Betaproteobacteria bacterium]|nr:universal stress protein [Betaproteobacteria bacterium]